ncbi:MAG: helix-turn-helix domain-containing protein [Acidimicrobiia bacterium]
MTSSTKGATNVAGDDYPPILDAAQVAELLGMNVQMVRRYAREGRLPAYKLPGSRTFKFLRDEVIEFLRAHPAVPQEDEDLIAAEEFAAGSP